MRLAAKVKLQTTPEQHQALKETMAAANACCNWLSDAAWQARKFGRFSLQKLVYHEARAHFPTLNSQTIIRCHAKVADAYRNDKRVLRRFKSLGAIECDVYLLTWFVDKRSISIWTVAGRMKLPFQAGPRQLKLLQGRIGQSDLLLMNGQFYLSATCQVETPIQHEVKDILGCDLGIVNLLTDSDGATFSGAPVEERRRKFAHRRRNLQRKGSKAARRKLRRLSGKQSRFQADVNHSISKHVVKKAQDTGCAIALENLGGIRNRATVRRPQRARHANWAFFQLRTFIEYKAQLAGIPVILVDPQNTSCTCPVCGCIDKANRRSQSLFLCVSCGTSAPADENAARNIRARAIVNSPMVAASPLAG